MFGRHLHRRLLSCLASWPARLFASILASRRPLRTKLPLGRESLRLRTHARMCRMQRWSMLSVVEDLLLLLYP